MHRAGVEQLLTNKAHAFEYAHDKPKVFFLDATKSTELLVRDVRAIIAWMQRRSDGRSDA